MSPSGCGVKPRKFPEQPATGRERAAAASVVRRKRIVKSPSSLREWKSLWLSAAPGERFRRPLRGRDDGGHAPRRQLHRKTALPGPVAAGDRGSPNVLFGLVVDGFVIGRRHDRRTAPQA